MEFFLWWTNRESDPALIHAMDAYYHYTIGPYSAAAFAAAAR